MPSDIVYKPVRFGAESGSVYVELHDDEYRRIPSLEHHAFAEMQKAKLTARVDPELLRAAVRAKSGVPVDVTASKSPLRRIAGR